MSKIKVSDDGVIKKIEYSSKYANGIFIAGENKMARKNCKILNIEVAGEENQLAQKVTKLGKTAILTTKVLGHYFQYIFKDYAGWDDFQELLQETPQQSREALNQVYNLVKIKDLKDLDLLGNPMDNLN